MLKLQEYRMYQLLHESLTVIFVTLWEKHGKRANRDLLITHVI